MGKVNMKVMVMANEAGLRDCTCNGTIGCLERFHTLTRNATLDEIADKISKMPFGDTAASFAVWIREQKK